MNRNCHFNFTPNCQPLWIFISGWISVAKLALLILILVLGQLQVPVDFYPPPPWSAALTNAFWMRSINTPAPSIHDGPNSEAKLQSESLCLILHSCGPPSFACPIPTFPPLSLVAPSNKSHWHKISSQDLLLGKPASDYFNLYTIILHQCTPFIFFLACVKSCYHTLTCLFTCLLFVSPMKLWINWRQGLYASP